MDNAQADDLYKTVGPNAMGQRVGGRGDREAALDVSLSETVPSADLGGSSKYSNENFEGRSGEGFRENSNWSRVTRS